MSAKDKATGKEQQIRIQASGGLSDEDIDKMVRDAEDNADTDKKRREAVEAKNQAESLIHQTETSLKELGDKLPEEEKTKVEDAIVALKDVMEGDDKAEIEAKTQDLMQASMKLGELAYKAAQEEGAGAADNESEDDVAEATAEAVDDDEVIDLEVEDEDDQKSA